MTKTTEQQIDLRKAARELMDASDYLTEKVQRFSVQGDKRFLDEYFNEAFEANRREEAIRIMSSNPGTNAALEKLQAAMNASVTLMNREYYAMRLVIEAMEYKEYPEIIKSVALSDEDKDLSAADKMRRAAEMVHDDEYYKQKDVIRQDMRDSLDELEKMAYNTDASALEFLRSRMWLVRLVIILQTIGIFFMVWLTSKLGIHPVLNAVDRIKADRPLPVVGANEFRYLARTYNRMYEVYKRSLERLNFKASHDELTGAYNRAGYDLLLSSIDLDSTYMMLFDVDDFKSINDTYGHEMGDKTLVRLVNILRTHSRSDDYICRIGGDEFVVFMTHVEKQHDLITLKIEEINKELGEASDEIVPMSVSVGIAHGATAKDPIDLFKKTDAAMYEAKRGGKSAYRFAD
ncbi:MAG: diguanylate cyclase [Clostridia bacterium]|nr:diguanylate cyclase [Clostridia bacterium]